METWNWALRLGAGETQVAEFGREPLQVVSEYVGAPALVRQTHPHDLIEAAWTAQGRVDVLGAVGGVIILDSGCIWLHRATSRCAESQHPDGTVISPERSSPVWTWNPSAFWQQAKDSGQRLRNGEGAGQRMRFGFGKIVGSDRPGTIGGIDPIDDVWTCWQPQRSELGQNDAMG